MTPFYAILLTIPPLLIFKGTELKKSYPLLLAFLGIAVANYTISLYTPKLLPNIFDGLQWNWLGKSAGIIFGLVIVALFRLWRFEEFNLRIVQRRSSYQWLGGFGAVLACIYLLDNTNLASSAEDILFQATLPGLHEELIFRSLLLGIALRLVERPELSRTRKQLYAIGIVSFLFGLGHVQFGNLTFSSESILHNFSAFAGSLLIGYLLGLTAVKSRSIVFPIIFHNAFNAIQYIGSPLY